MTALTNAQNRFEWLVARGVSSCSFFGVFDGHGGSHCADYLRDKLHSRLFAALDLKDPASSIRHCLQLVDQEVLDRAAKDAVRDASGSCALGALLLGSRSSRDASLFVFNVGDSLAVLSRCAGAQAVAVNRLHRPDEQSELVRVFRNGGRVYR